MLKVAHASPAFAPRDKTQQSGDGFPLVLEADVNDPVELVDEMLQLGGDGDTSREHSQEVTADFAGEEDAYEAEKKAFEQEFKDYEDDDSDYAPQEDEEDESEEEFDEEEEQELLRTLESALDEHADEVGDFYLKRMLEKRDSLDAEEAAWVDSYIVRQREWKEAHGTSIDEMDLDLRLRAHLSKKKLSSDVAEAEADEDQLKKPATQEDQSQLNTLMETLNGRALPYLPPSLRNQPTELLLSLVGVVLFLVIAVAVQFYVAFKEPLYS